MPKIPRTQFRKLLKEKLAGHGFGEYEGWDLPTEWRYRLPVGIVGGRNVHRQGGRSRQLTFGHIIANDPESVPLLEPGVRLTSVGLLGFLAPWDILTSEDLPEAADDLTVLIRHFLNVVPSLLKGIEPTCP